MWEQEGPLHLPGERAGGTQGGRSSIAEAGSRPGEGRFSDSQGLPILRRPGERRPETQGPPDPRP